MHGYEVDFVEEGPVGHTGKGHESNSSNFEPNMLVFS